MEVVYLAARYDRKAELLPYVEQLTAAGIDCTSRWITEEPDLETIPERGRQQHLIKWSLNDAADVAEADTLVFFSEELGEDGDFLFHDDEGNLWTPAVWARGGRHVEFGMAIAFGLRVIVIGPRMNIFHHLPQVDVFESWEEFAAKELAVSG